MKKKEYSKVTPSPDAQTRLQQLHNTLTAKNFASRTIRNYMQEMRFFICALSRLGAGFNWATRHY